MSVLPIVRFPNKVLREKLVEVKTDECDSVFTGPGDSLVRSLNDMEDTLEATTNGMALAANQVGLYIRAIVFRQWGSYPHADDPRNYPDPDGPPPWVVNPRIVSVSDQREEMDEGCLSFPNFYRKKSRAVEVKVEFDEVRLVGPKMLEIEFIRTTQTFTGRWAQAFQHEIEHLDGQTFVDDLPKPERERIAVSLLKGSRKR